jgi:alpha-1,3-mannosyltransferase
MIDCCAMLITDSIMFANLYIFYTQKFLQEDTFISKPLSITLLMLHISTLVFFAKKWIDISRKRRRNNGKSICLGPRLDQTYIAYTLFVSNFIGIVFARTLHYQFYSWYFHTVPLLLWMTDLPLLTKIVVMGLIEYAFNVFPATSMSSASLQFAHFVTLISLWKAKFPCIITSQEQS